MTTTMPVNFQWGNTEQTLLQIAADGVWTWHEFDQCVASAASLIASVRHRVDIIQTIQPGSAVPRGNTFAHFERTIETLPKNFGVQVVVTTDPFLRRLIYTYTRITDRRLHRHLLLASTVEEARTLITRHRANA